MQIASILSDLTSLRVCDHAAALALVSTHRRSLSAAADNSATAPAPSTPKLDSSSNLRQQTSHSSGPSPAGNEDAAGKDADADLQRVFDLVELHYGVKERYTQSGGSEGLEKARAEVERVVREFSLR